jgi:putative peptidoglycan lipid II flippase
MLAAAAIMAAVLEGARRLLEVWLAAPGIRFVALAALVAIGVAAYAAAALLLGAAHWHEVRGWLRRGPRTPAADSGATPDL